VEISADSSAPPGDLASWALSILTPGSAEPVPPLTTVAGDASNRRYFRAMFGGLSYVLVDSPPATEKNQAFLAVRELFAGAGVRVPALYAADLERGYMVLEDLGDQLLLEQLRAGAGAEPYTESLDLLLRMRAIDVHGLSLPAYDEALLREELGRFPAWFVQALLEQSLDASEERLLAAVFDILVSSALEQPTVVVHRDFHSRNLMPQPGGGLGVIDFQDAVVGPVTYDLVSLLRDCYIQWPPEQVEQWALSYRGQLHRSGLPGVVAPEHFLRWFDLMGLQRHIKVLGTFARLYLRDGKSTYLADLPLVIHYVQEIAHRYAGEEPLLGEFQQWFAARLSPVIAGQSWSAAR